MCKFIKELYEKEFERLDSYYDQYYSDDMKVRQFDQIKINDNISLSIQASYVHRCTPRKTIKDIESYTHWEFACLYDGNFVRISQIKPEFSSLAELEYYFDGSVYNFVPKDLVEELYIALK